MHPRFWSVCLLSLVLSVPHAALAQRIERNGDNPALVLRAAMQAALQEFDSAFAPRQLSDYPPWLWQPRCAAPSDCHGPLFQVTDRQALFAVVGDFNGDGVQDVVVDGDNGREGARLLIMSDGAGFRVERLHPLGVVPATIRRFRSQPRAADQGDLGVGQGLSLVEPGTITSHWEDGPLVLSTDAFIVSHFEKAGTLYYYRNGRWHQYTISD